MTANVAETDGERQRDTGCCREGAPVRDRVSLSILRVLKSGVDFTVSAPLGLTRSLSVSTFPQLKNTLWDLAVHHRNFALKSVWLSFKREFHPFHRPGAITHTQTLSHTHSHTQTHSHTHTLTHKQAHSHTHTHTYTHKHTHTQHKRTITHT